jgi:hypothetical protein
MPHRHWYAIVSVGGVQRRLGPYATRRMAERKARELFKGAERDEVSVIYEVDRTAPHAGRY